jgi:hypothetical protein
VRVTLRTLEEHDLGLSWTLDEKMERSAHALLVDGGVWLVDPVDEPEALERAAALGPIAGVLQLLDRHRRDCTALAQRLGAELHVVPDALPGTPLRVVPVMRSSRWREVALWWEAKRALVVPEALGTAALFTVGAGPVGVHPLLRLLSPPQALRGFAPEHLLVGHGPTLHDPQTGPAIDRAIDHARRDAPRLLLTLPKVLLG